MAEKCKNIVQQGEMVKFKITINQQGFVQNEDDFRVRLTYGMLRKEMVIEKKDMISNSNDEWFFMFPTDDMVGLVMASCEFDVPDGDYKHGYRREVDRQYILAVITHPFPARVCVPSPSDNHVVTYERTEESDVAELYMYLQDRSGRNFKTSDDMYLLVLKKEANN